MDNLTNRLISEFADGEYAHSYMQAHTVTRIAAQVHAIRKQRGWSQGELAEAAGITQERVSKIESADFESVTLKTLNKFADAFDVHLHVAFVPFSEGIVDVANISPSRLEVRPREVDFGDLADRRAIIIRASGGWKVVENHLRSVATPKVSGPIAHSAPSSVSSPIGEKWNQLLVAEI